MMLLWLTGLIVTVVLFALVIRVAVAIIRVSLAVLTAIAFALMAMALAGLDPSNDPQSFIGTFLLGLLPALWLTFRVRRESKNVAQPRLTRMGDVPLQPLGKPGPEARIDAKLLDRLDAAGRVGRWVGRSRRDAATNRNLAVA